MDPRRAACLELLGVELWRRRERPPTALGEAVAAAGRAAEALGPQAAVGAADAAAGRAAEALGPQEAVGAADAAVAAMDWQTLESTVASCSRCALSCGRTRTVFGTGARSADWMVVGEAPGAEEDRQGEPFVGRAGQLLNSMLAAIGLARGQVYIANILKCRPPDNRDPKPEESAQCWPYLQRQIELVSPRIILCVGRIAAQSLLQTTTPIGKLRGRSWSFGAAATPLVVTYHPAYLLRSPREKRRAWEDLLLARSLAGKGGR